MDYIKSEDREKVTEVKLLRKNTAVIFCKTWEDCKIIVDSRKNVNFENEKVSFSLFSEEKP